MIFTLEMPRAEVPHVHDIVKDSSTVTLEGMHSDETHCVMVVKALNRAELFFVLGAYSGTLTSPIR